MRRALALFLSLAVLASAAVWLVERPGSVAVTWLGYRVESSVPVLAVLLGLGFLILLSAVEGLRWLAGWPFAFRRLRGETRRRRAIVALTEGLSASAAGEAATAGKLAAKAGRLVPNDPLALLLAAQAAQVANNFDAARRHFAALAERPETAFLGARGLYMLADRDGDAAEALAQARRAQSLRPNSPWSASELLRQEIAAGEWSAAEASLQRARNLRAIGEAEATRRQAVLLHCAAVASDARGEESRAIQLARRAVALAPDLEPAAALAGRLLAAAGDVKQARQLLGQAWVKVPHPELAAAFLATAQPQPKSRLEAARQLAGFNPGHVESHLLVADAALEAGDLTTARQHLERAAGAGQSRRFCQMMAEIKGKGEHDRAAADAWHIKAADAPPTAVWQCRACGWQAAQWAARCPHCGEFDSARWQLPLGSEPSPTPPTAAPATLRR
ncbi:MAG: heme biosynthesis protein HemY [Alphaproteobacteria bacterium]|nr:heme biosynthesis protein HemY [Alphaproteobacteria bacterium]